MPAKYVIRELSAIAVMMNAVLNEDGRYTFYLNEETTRRCIIKSCPFCIRMALLLLMPSRIWRIF